MVSELRVVCVTIPVRTSNDWEFQNVNRKTNFDYPPVQWPKGNQNPHMALAGCHMEIEIGNLKSPGANWRTDFAYLPPAVAKGKSKSSNGPGRHCNGRFGQTDRNAGMAL